MVDGLEDARLVAHGTYDDVIVVEHRHQAGAGAVRGAASQQDLPPHVVLEMPEGTRVIDWAPEYDIDGVLGRVPPTAGASYRVIIGPPTGTAAAVDPAPGSLRYETMQRGSVR
jgi:hypothetical protein